MIKKNLLKVGVNPLKKFYKLKKIFFSVSCVKIIVEFKSEIRFEKEQISLEI